MIIMLTYLPGLAICGCSSYNCATESEPQIEAEVAGPFQDPFDSGPYESEVQVLYGVVPLPAADSSPTESVARYSAEIFQGTVDYGPVKSIAEFLDSKSRTALLNSNKNLRDSSMFYATTVYQIPDGASNENVLANLPYIRHFANVRIGWNLDYLAILKQEYPCLRHLIVRSAVTTDRIEPFMNSLSAYTNLPMLLKDGILLTSLKSISPDCQVHFAPQYLPESHLMSQLSLFKRSFLP
jgi:hypothetical protein